MLVTSAVHPTKDARCQDDCNLYLLPVVCLNLFLCFVVGFRLGACDELISCSLLIFLFSLVANLAYPLFHCSA